MIVTESPELFLMSPMIYLQTLCVLSEQRKCDLCYLLFHSDSVHIGTAGTEAEEEFEVQEKAETEYRGGRR